MKFSPHRLREGQAIVVMGLIDRAIRGERMTSVLLHPRGGKSLVQRLVSLWAVSVGLCCAGVSINPNLLLRDQMGDEDRRRSRETLRMEEALEWCEIDPKTLGFPVGVTCHKYWPDDPLANDEVFVSFTMQSLVAKAGHDGLMAWTESMVAAGRPPIFFFDECQMLGPDQPWGRLFHELYELGAYVVTMTGTAHRSDGEVIPGFHEEIVEVSDIERTITENDPDPDFIQVVKLGGRNYKIRQRADIEVGLRYGWNPIKGQQQALCNLSYRTFDFPVEIKDNGKDVHSGMVSDVPRRYVTDAVRKGVWKQEVIDGAVDILVEELSHFRQSD